MVAETLTGTRAAATFPVYKPSGAGDLACAYGFYSVAAAVEVGDIFRLCRLPPGAVVVGGQFWGSDMDTGSATIDIDLGYAANGAEIADPDAFVNSGVVDGTAITNLKAAGSFYRPFVMAAGPITVTRETTVQAEVIAVAATFAAGTIYCRVDYVVP